MLAMNNYSRRYRATSNLPTTFNNCATTSVLIRPRLPLRTYMKPKSSCSLANPEISPFSRSKRFKSRKINGCQKIEIAKKKTPDYTENAYREAVSKLKYLLAETYAPRLTTGKMPRERGIYRRSTLRISESPEDSDERSVSGCSRAKGFSPGNKFEDGNADETTDESRRLVGASQNSVSYPTRDVQSSPSELTSFIARQEEYIEQLEQESRYCKDELKNLLGKIREVVAENEALHDKNKAGLLKSFLHEYETCDENETPEAQNQATSEVSSGGGKKVNKLQRRLEGPSIVFESRISELEAQLTQARIELKKLREENDSCSRRLAEASGNQASPDFLAQLENALRDKQELAAKLEEAARSAQAARERETETSQRAKRAAELAQRSDLDKYQADAEIRRLNDELDRLREKLREAAQDTSKRVAEERHQIERRYGQQVEQLSADVASHWDAASKSQLETDRQRRELADVKRDLAQKQSMIDELKKELQNKISNLQSELNRTIAEKDAADQEIAASKLAAERSERHFRQEQNRWQAEINSYKQRLERADADIVHCRRENLRLSEQIASLEKELNMSKLVQPLESQAAAATPRPEGEKDLTTMIMDVETKNEKPVEAGANRGGINPGATPSKKKRTVKVDLRVKVTPKKKSVGSRLVTLSAQQEMAGLQSNLEYLSSKITDTLENRKAELVSDRKEAQRSNGSDPNEAQFSETDPATADYSRDGRYETESMQYPVSENADRNDSRLELADDPANYAMTSDEKYDGQEYPDQNYAGNYVDEGYDRYGQYDDQSAYQEQSDEQPADQPTPTTLDVAHHPNQQRYEDYPDESHNDNQTVVPATDDDRRECERPIVPTDSKISEG